MFVKLLRPILGNLRLMNDLRKGDYDNEKRLYAFAVFLCNIFERLQQK